MNNSNSTDIMAALRAANKHVQAAQQQYKELATEFKLPPETYKLKLEKAEMTVINGTGCLALKYLVLGSPKSDLNGYTSKEIFFLSSDWNIGKALVLLNSMGVDVKGYHKNEQFIHIVIF